MVAKHFNYSSIVKISLNLAKIHMVAKPFIWFSNTSKSLNLAKIHMVAKPQTDSIT